MSLDLDVVYAAIVDLVNGITGEPCIIADQNGPAIIGPYSTIKVTSINGLGIDLVQYKDQADPSLDVDEVIRGFRDLTVSMHFLKDHVGNTARRVRLLLQSNAAMSKLTAANLGLGVRSDVRDFPAIEESRSEPQQQMDVNFYALDDDVLTVNSIRSAEIDGEVHIDGHVTELTINVQE